jgi:hypothetical protein
MCHVGVGIVSRVLRSLCRPTCISLEQPAASFVWWAPEIAFSVL